MLVCIMEERKLVSWMHEQLVKMIAERK
jgi:hypothetical protein